MYKQHKTKNKHAINSNLNSNNKQTIQLQAQTVKTPTKQSFGLNVCYLLFEISSMPPYQNQT